MINKKELAPGILLYEGIESDVLKKIKSIESSLWDNEYVMKDGITYLNLNNRSTRSITLRHDDLDNEFVKTFRETLDPIEKDYQDHFGITVKSHDVYKILKYSKNSKFDNHMDDGGGNFRRVSTVFYLNSEFKGGEVVFPRFEISIKPKEGDMLIFPSAFSYNHYVTEITEGERYCVASWIR